MLCISFYLSIGEVASKFVLGLSETKAFESKMFVFSSQWVNSLDGPKN
jgi:hypothetical protein